MSTLLDLIQEWAAINEAKTLAGGRLPDDGEARWDELREFYELLMAQDGLCPQPAVRYTAGEIREKVSTRSRLRVRTELEIVVMKNDEVHFARVGNLSCGGVLLLTDSGLDIGSGLLLHLANVSRGAELMPTQGSIVWRADSNGTSETFRYRMGVQFAALGEKETRTLDDYVVDCLETKLLSLSRDVLDGTFVEKEQLEF